MLLQRHQKIHLTERAQGGGIRSNSNSYVPIQCNVIGKLYKGMNTEKKALCSEKPRRWSSVVGMIVLGVICLYCIWQDYLFATIEAATVPTRRIWLVGVGALLVVLTETCHAILTSHKATENTLWRDVVYASL